MGGLKSPAFMVIIKSILFSKEEQSERYYFDYNNIIILVEKCYSIM